MGRHAFLKALHAGDRTTHRQAESWDDQDAGEANGAAEIGGDAPATQIPLLPPDFLALAQLEEYRSTKPKAAGSIPAGEAIQQRVAQQRVADSEQARGA